MLRDFEYAYCVQIDRDMYFQIAIMLIHIVFLLLFCSR